MNETDLLKRIADYVRLEIETGTIDPKSPVGITWRDYAIFKLQTESGYYAGVLLHMLGKYFPEAKP